MSPSLTRAQIAGQVEPGFEPVREEFERNFLDQQEVGAACAVYHRGQKVVDLWGGVRDKDTGEPWQEDTLVAVFSVGKGMAAATMAVAHARGLFELDQPVAKYWPEFAQNGKGKIKVRQLLSRKSCHSRSMCVSPAWQATR